MGILKIVSNFSKGSYFRICASNKCRQFSTKIEPINMAYNYFESSGTNHMATPLIIMHGLFGSKQNWRSVGRALESKLKIKVYTVDARNHGESPHTTQHSSSMMAADVAHFIKNLGLQKANVMGHSMGGRTMMHLALKYPELVNTGIIVDISPVSVPRDFFRMEQIFAAMMNISVPSELSLSQARIVVENQIKEAVDDKDTVDFIMLNLKKKENGEFHWAVNVKTLGENLRLFSNFLDHVKDVDPFQGPMLFIGGTKSNFLDPDHWPAIQHIFPNSELHWLDTAHLVHFERPHEFIDLVVNFLKK